MKRWKWILLLAPFAGYCEQGPDEYDGEIATRPKIVQRRVDESKHASSANQEAACEDQNHDQSATIVQKNDASSKIENKINMKVRQKQKELVQQGSSEKKEDGLKEAAVETEIVHVDSAGSNQVSDLNHDLATANSEIGQKASTISVETSPQVDDHGSSKLAAEVHENNQPAVSALEQLAPNQHSLDIVLEQKKEGGLADFQELAGVVQDNQIKELSAEQRADVVSSIDSSFSADQAALQQGLVSDEIASFTSQTPSSIEMDGRQVADNTQSTQPAPAKPMPNKPGAVQGPVAPSAPAAQPPATPSPGIESSDYPGGIDAPAKKDAAEPSSPKKINAPAAPTSPKPAPAPTQPVPVAPKPVPAKPAPTQPAPVPAKPVPAKPAPAQPAPAKPAPAPTQPAPVPAKPVPAKPVPAKPAPAQPAPAKPAPAAKPQAQGSGQKQGSYSKYKTSLDADDAVEEKLDSVKKKSKKRHSGKRSSGG
ncbi:MAG: hypothetical protein EB051_00450 [Chlamydiia bacterium]|nr:hypothetical protein [Chlamydiia bacterium]